VPTVRVPDETRQLLTATVPDWSSTTAELRLWHRDGAGAPWTADGPAWTGVVGHTGLAWGRGAHGDGIPAGRPGELKREGDGKSPAGMFAIGRTFGYAPAAPPGARVAYTAVDAAWRCVDDPASAHYTQILDERTVTPDWTSAEHLRRDDALYTWVVELRHNPAAVPGGGSCIFLHVWDGPADTTVGCTAMPEPTLAGVIARLDPDARPMVAILPRAEYDALAADWSLPR
jgi:L,D-peptidoglycan transpeptidase YkuD (ErfK/YbiS/YcfS/YnhG family)